MNNETVNFTDESFYMTVIRVVANNDPSVKLTYDCDLSCCKDNRCK